MEMMKGTDLLLLLLLMMTAERVLTDSEDRVEYCAGETFHAECPQDQVVVMTYAYYGRKNVGRCIKMDFLNCGREILDVMDKKCSGRRECEVGVDPWNLTVLDDCHTKSGWYLEASYTCTPVVVGPEGLCRLYEEVELEASSGYFSSHVTSNTGCGGEDMPWVIYVWPGQHINFTLIDFGNTKDDQCLTFAEIREGKVLHEILTCGHRKARFQRVATLPSGKVEVRIKKQIPSQINGRERFLLEYQVYGCTTPLLPSHMWMTQNESVATVGCPGAQENASKGRWHFFCRDSVWVGEFGNCTASVPTLSEVFGIAFVNTLLKLQLEVLVVILGVAVIVGMLIFPVMFLLIRRFWSKRERGERLRAIFVRMPVTENEYA